MKVYYKDYPNHIGHMDVLGCFRCHDNQLISESGKVISKACNLCHTIMSQERGHEMQYTSIDSDTLFFIHPEHIGDEWKETNCVECHSDLY